MLPYKLHNTYNNKNNNNNNDTNNLYLYCRSPVNITVQPGRSVSSSSQQNDRKRDHSGPNVLATVQPTQSFNVTELEAAVDDVFENAVMVTDIYDIYENSTYNNNEMNTSISLNGCAAMSVVCDKQSCSSHRYCTGSYRDNFIYYLFHH